jgi:hypothetical protein
MEAYHVDMAGPDPTHEAAYSRIRRVVQENRAFIDALVAAPPSKMVGNWKVELVKKNRDIVALRGLWARDREFRKYLVEKMEFHFGAPYTAALVRIFLS